MKKGYLRVKKDGEDKYELVSIIGATEGKFPDGYCDYVKGKKYLIERDGKFEEVWSEDVFIIIEE